MFQKDDQRRIFSMKCIFFNKNISKVWENTMNLEKKGNR